MLLFSPPFEPWCVHLSLAAFNLLCFAHSNQYGDEPSQQPQPSDAQLSGAGETQPLEPATQPLEQPDSGSPPQQAVLDTSEARKHLQQCNHTERTWNSFFEAQLLGSSRDLLLLLYDVARPSRPPAASPARSAGVVLIRCMSGHYGNSRRATPKAIRRKAKDLRVTAQCSGPSARPRRSRTAGSCLKSPSRCRISSFRLMQATSALNP